MHLIKVIMRIDGKRDAAHAEYERQVSSIKKDITSETRELQVKIDSMNRLIKKNIAADISMATGGRK